MVGYDYKGCCVLWREFLAIVVCSSASAVSKSRASWLRLLYRCRKSSSSCRSKGLCGGSCEIWPSERLPSNVEVCVLLWKALGTCRARRW